MGTPTPAKRVAMISLGTGFFFLVFGLYDAVFSSSTKSMLDLILGQLLFIQSALVCPEWWRGTVK